MAKTLNYLERSLGTVCQSTMAIVHMGICHCKQTYRVTWCISNPCPPPLSMRLYNIICTAYQSTQLLSQIVYEAFACQLNKASVQIYPWCGNGVSPKPWCSCKPRPNHALPSCLEFCLGRALVYHIKLKIHFNYACHTYNFVCIIQINLQIIIYTSFKPFCF